MFTLSEPIQSRDFSLTSQRLRISIRAHSRIVASSSASPVHYNVISTSSFPTSSPLPLFRWTRLESSRNTKGITPLRSTGQSIRGNDCPPDNATLLFLSLVLRLLQFSLAQKTTFSNTGRNQSWRGWLYPPRQVRTPKRFRIISCSSHRSTGLRSSIASLILLVFRLNLARRNLRSAGESLNAYQRAYLKFRSAWPGGQNDSTPVEIAFSLKAVYNTLMTDQRMQELPQTNYRASGCCLNSLESSINCQKSYSSCRESSPSKCKISYLSCSTRWRQQQLVIQLCRKINLNFILPTLPVTMLFMVPTWDASIF